MNRVGALAFLSLAFLVAAYLSPPARKARLEARALSNIEEFRTQGIAHTEAMTFLFVDDCSGINHSPENTYPSKLLAPVAYVPGPLMDPFSPSGEPARFVQQHLSGNGARYVFVSRGPDGDWDMDRVTLRVKFRPMVYIGDDPAYQNLPRPPQTLFNYHTATPDRETTEYVDASGQTIPIPVAEAVYLPGRPNDRPRFNYDALIREWARDGVSIYDPTNGTLSDGDLLLLDPLLLKLND